MKKKVLIYNWIPFDETEGKGGGVTVYTRNLIEVLAKQQEWEIFFLSSGRAYDRKRKGAFVERTANILGKQCRSYQVVNSPVLSSAHLSFAYPEDMLEDRVLKEVFRSFFRKHGGFDVIHFQNLEGLSLSVLELKEEFPETKFIYSLHNYYPFCPQVMLWKNDRENCEEPRCGACCITCMPKDVHKVKVIYNQQVSYERMKNGDIPKYYREFQAWMERTYRMYDKYRDGRQMPAEKKRLAQMFQTFRERNVWYLNQYMDRILAVSGRVREIAIRCGLDAGKISVNYIGTEAASRQKECQMYPYNGKVFWICYLGYMRRNKGFYFLLDALEHMPLKLAEKVGVKLAVPVPDEKIKARIEHLKGRFAQVVHYPGYTHEQLGGILEHVQMGIVPSLWEDNLPQVAIEMKAQGVPVLTSHLGGAKELTLSKEFVFQAGEREELIRKIENFVKTPERLEEYWDHAPRLKTMAEHVEELGAFYF